MVLNTNPYTFLGNRPLDFSPAATLDRGLVAVTFRSLDLRTLLPWDAETVLASVRRATHAFADHDRLMPRISIARWLAGSASTILFVRREPGLTSSEVVAVEASLRDHAMLSRMDVFPLALPSQSMEMVDGHR